MPEVALQLLNVTPAIGPAALLFSALPGRRWRPDVTSFKAAGAKRLQADRWRRRLGLRCLTVRVNDRIVRHLISRGYLSLESSDATTAYLP